MRLKMKGEILTPRFWDEVDHLATQTTALLLPLINFQGKVAPTANWPRLVTIHQELHNIIAMAGYTALCMSWWPSIFRVDFPGRGQRWDLNQNHVDVKIYQTSKRKARKYDNAQEAILYALESSESEKLSGEQYETPEMEEYDETESEDDTTDDELSLNLPFLVDKIRLLTDEEDNTTYDELSPDLPIRVAKVKMALWPLVERYKPLGKAAGYGAPGGERITTIMKSQVVYYSGLADDEGESDEHQRLRHYIPQVRRARLVREKETWWAVFILLVISVLLVLTWYYPVLRQLVLKTRAALAFDYDTSFWFARPTYTTYVIRGIAAGTSV